MTPTVQAYLFALLHLAPATLGVYHILLYKRDPRAAMGWITVCLFVPFGGPIAYFLFGINRVRSRAKNIKRPFLSIVYEAGYRRAATATTSSKGLRAVGERITGLLPSTGNGVAIFHNGDTAYPAMIASINAAKDRVLLATYILKTDVSGSAFVDALVAAQERGVRVLVLVDGVGEMYSWRRPSKLLREQGVKAARFLPPKIFPPSVYLNLRNHRKLLVVDNEIAYAGGMNIGDEHVATDTQARRVTDVHFSFRGPIIDSLAEVFYRDWQFTTGEAYQDEAPGERVTDGGAHCRTIPDGPDAEMDALALTIQSVVSCATDSVAIMTPYFLPSRELVAALQAAALRGVSVRIVLPAKNNLFYVHWANRNVLTELLNWGVKACYQPAPFCHTKLLCVDNDYSLVGSANLDPRSLRLNFELGIEIFSEGVCAELRAHIDRVISESTAITLDELAQRSVPTRLRDSIAGLFSPYL